MKVHANITKRRQRRRMRTGEYKEYDRYVLNYRDPKTGKRVQQFYEKQKEAQAAMRDLLVAIEQGHYHDRQQEHLTVADAFDCWVNDRRSEVKNYTSKGYDYYRKYIVGPLLSGTAKQRMDHSFKKKVPDSCRYVPMLGDFKITELTTADIRAWNKKLAEMVGVYTANKSGQRLKTILALAAEDYNLRPPMMPRRLGRGPRKVKKTILMPEQVGLLLAQARQDKKWGIYYAFPFMAGTRPSEQLALHWEDVDFDRGVITIRRMLEKDGAITNFTKTEAGMREIPMWSLLREMLLEWKERCPKHKGELKLVFPGQGTTGRWPYKKIIGGVLLYANFRNRVWRGAFKKLAEQGLSYVTPHSARHCFISTLQAQGVEVGLVAKLAGHASAVVTLGHYTQAVRGGKEAVETLSTAFGLPSPALPAITGEISGSAPLPL